MAAEAPKSHPEFSQGDRRNIFPPPPASLLLPLLDVPSSLPPRLVLNHPVISSCKEGWESFFGGGGIPNGRYARRELRVAVGLAANHVGPSALSGFVLATKG